MNNEVKKALKAPRSSLALMLAGLLMNENMAGFVDMAKVKERIADMGIEGTDLQIAKLEEEILEDTDYRELYEEKIEEGYSVSDAFLYVLNLSFKLKLEEENELS